MSGVNREKGYQQMNVRTRNCSFDIFWALFIEVSKNNWFCVIALHDCLKKLSPLFLIQSEVNQNHSVTRSHMFSRALRQLEVFTMSFDSFFGGIVGVVFAVWPSVITLVLVLRHSIKICYSDRYQRSYWYRHYDLMSHPQTEKQFISIASMWQLLSLYYKQTVAEGSWAGWQGCLLFSRYM